MKFSLIVPNYNGAEFLPDCLKSLPKHQEIIIVDNGSTDKSLHIAQKIIPEIKIIKNPSNFGFAKAINQGVLAAKNDYVALINNDLILSSNWFDHITQAIIQNPKAVVFCGLVLDKSGTRIESEGLQYFIKGKCLNINNGRPIHKPARPCLPAGMAAGGSYIINRKSCFIWGANAAATTYHRQTLIDVGLFDEDFFAYEEDVDLSLRLTKLGLKTLYVPQAVSYHLGGGTSSQMGNFRNRMDAKNWIYIIVKNYSFKEFVSNFFPLMIERLRNLSGLLKNTPPSQIIPSLLSAYGEVLLKLPKMFGKRQQLAKLIHDYRY